mgnify:CR=1 FL=1
MGIIVIANNSREGIAGKRKLLSKFTASILGIESSIRDIRKSFVKLLSARINEASNKIMEATPIRNTCDMVMYLLIKLRKVSLDLPTSSIEGDRYR